MAHSTSIRSLLLLLAVALLLPGCTNDPLSYPNTMQIVPSNLPMLDGNAYYELWFSYPPNSASIKNPTPDHSASSYFSVGRFRIDAFGNIVGANGGSAVFAIPNGYNPSLLIDAILTVQNADSASTEPGPILLAGPFSGTTSQGRDTLVANDGEAFGSRLYAADSGRMVLDAPTSGAPGDSARGIWFADIRRDANDEITQILPGLTFHAMPLNLDNSAWRYQAWLVRTGTTGKEYIPLGSFSAPNAPDANGAGPGAGPNLSNAYSLPGEDFVGGSTPRALNDGTYGVVISVDPTNVVLKRPLLTLLRRDLIETGTPARRTISLGNQPERPKLEVVIDR